MSERPLVSLILVAYRQQSMVAEAVRGALAQTYSPLEIVLSDDCSPDGTFQVMEELVAAYEGPHRVVLNRNPVNLGLIEHFNRVFARASGDLLVMGAGDDVSLPQRVEVLVDHWLLTGRKAMAIYSSYEAIGPAGERLGEHLYPVDGYDRRSLLEALATPRFSGSSAAYARQLVEGLVLPPGGVEDLTLYYRGALMRRILYLREPLVRYRFHDQSVSAGAERSFVFRDKRKAVWRRAALSSLLPEVEALLPAEEKANLAAARRYLRWIDIKAESRIRVLEGFVGRWSERVFGLRERHRFFSGVLLAPLRLLYRLGEIALSVRAVVGRWLKPAD